MALMDVVHYGDPILRKKCRVVKDFKGLNKLINDMFDTMYEENGIGLAANQVGVDLNLFIIDISDIEGEGEGESIHIFINGQIIDSSGESWFEEGCLSIPDVRLDVKRPEKIIFKYQDIDGFARLVGVDEILANDASLLVTNYVKSSRIIERDRLSLSETFKNWEESSNLLHESMSQLFKTLS